MNRSEAKSKLIIVGGPNGSGKTTLASEILAEQNYHYISADHIAYELAPDNPASVKIKAGKIFFDRLQEAVDQKHNILIESTLSGKSLIPLIKKFKEDFNYHITVVFVFLSNPEICVQRVAIRVKKGGHHVPSEDIYRRFGRSYINFWDIYKELSHHWYLYYTSEDYFQEVARKSGKDQYVLNEKLFVTFEKLKKHYEQK
ncbi:MAG: AAA family ATPase [Balneolales bacterium]